MIVRTQTDTGSQNKEYRQYSFVDGVQLTYDNVDNMAAPTNASKWRMGFNSAFKRLI